MLELYHGSSSEVKIPDLSKSRVDIDFGVGFYLTEDDRMAKKWAAGKSTSYINTYNLNEEGLSIHKFSLDKEWLDFVKDNRMLLQNDKYSGYDVLIGPTADDKLYDTLREYLDGTMTANETLKVLDCLGFSEQIVLKTQKAIDKLTFVQAKQLHGMEQQAYRNIIRSDRREAANKTLELKRRFARERELAESKKSEVSEEVKHHGHTYGK